MNLKDSRDIDAIVAACNEAVEHVMNARRCPNCHFRGLEIFSLSHPCNYTGIFRCLNPDCHINEFDPQLPYIRPTEKNPNNRSSI
jgi:hypothetical protein